MPLTARPGVFRGRMNDFTDWFVVDPAWDAEAVERAWRAYAPRSNTPTWKRVRDHVVGWGAFAAALAAGVALSGAFADAVDVGWLVVPGWVVSFVVAVLVAVGALSVVSGPDSDAHPVPPVGGVLMVPTEVVRWADDGVSREVIWRLARAAGELLDASFEPQWQIQARWEQVGDPEDLDRLLGVVDEVDRVRWLRSVAQLDSLADEVGFPVPDYWTGARAFLD